MDIEFKEGAVCFADGEYHYPARKGSVEDSQGFETSFLNIMNYSDFQLNNIKQGDYIEASELDTEKKYNDAVEVFELFGFKRSGNYQRYKDSVDNWADFLGCGGDMDVLVARNKGERKITLNQLRAIGELKRLDLKIEKAESKEWFPVVGSKVTWVEREIVGTVKCIDKGLAWILCPTGQHTQQKVSSLKPPKPPKTPEELLHDELVAMRNKTEEYFIDKLLKNFKLIRKEAV